jgi:thiamine-phosphate pyrophosphorylase
LKKSSGTSQKFSIGRIVDANLNRAKEGLRVCEEIARFILNHHKITAQLKALRHRINVLGAKFYPRKVLLGQRQAISDVGRLNSRGELKRANYGDVFFANIQRVKESLRVLEEFSKLTDAATALRFKALRYKVYELEQAAFKKISSLPDLR